MIEEKSALTSSENLHSYVGWVEFARSLPVVFDKGPIVAIGTYSEAPFTWRPLLGRRLSPGWNYPPDWLVAYRHPTVIVHSGSGWQWVETLLPQAPFDGLICPGLYIASAPFAVMPMTEGRAEIGSDAQGVVTLAENQYQTPAMGIRYLG